MTRRAALIEVSALWIVTLLVIRLVVALQPVIPGYILQQLSLATVPILFMYVPVWYLRRRGEDPDQYPLYVPALSDPANLRALRDVAILIALVALPFFALYDLWHTWLFPEILQWINDQGWARTVRWPELHFGKRGWPSAFGLVELIGYQLFYVAIAEEFFYRGYMQSRLDDAFGTPWTILGAKIGPGLLITCVLFAFGHSVVVVQWWHFAIIVPSLAFGWLRARTGGVIAGALFHAWCNITVRLLDHTYGLGEAL